MHTLKDYTYIINIRAEKQKIFQCGGLKDADLNQNQKSLFFKAIGREVKPLVSFWDSKDRWTVLTGDSIYSQHDGQFQFCALQEIKNKIEGIAPDGGKHRQETKKTTEILFLVFPKIYIWAPSGEALYAVWHILKYC